MAERIGIFGGTFDPPHIGHLVLAAQARAQLHLDRVLLVVAHDPWQKRGQRVVSSAEARFEMVEAAVDGHVGLEASRIELDRGGPSYTIDTVITLDGATRELFVIVGSDLIAQLPTWKRWEELPPLVTLAVAPRAGAPSVEVALPWRWVALRLPALEISSSALRAMLADDLPLEFLVPDATISVIMRHRLYRSPRP